MNIEIEFLDGPRRGVVRFREPTSASTTIPFSSREFSASLFYALTESGTIGRAVATDASSSWSESGSGQDGPRYRVVERDESEGWVRIKAKYEPGTTPA